MVKTTKVAADRAYDRTKTVLPTEVARGVYIEKSPSAQALKLMHLLVAQAGGRMAEEVRHDMRLSDIRKIEGMRNHDRASLRILFSELRAAILIHGDKEKMRLTIDGLIDRAQIDYREESTTGDLAVSWWFSKTFREIAAASTHWTVMDRQTVFALRSKYSIHLFQHIASLVRLDDMACKRFTVSELRAALGVPEGKMVRWTHLYRDVLKPAVAEINQLARFDIFAVPIKRGRYIEAVEISWQPKPDPTEVKRELDRSNIGRKVRREGTAEVPVSEFPADGPIQYVEPWATIAKTHGNGKDINLIASDFRAWCSSKKIALTGPNIAPNIPKTFESFCKHAKI